MSYDPDPFSPPPQSPALQERVKMPGIFLAVVGVINILIALYVLLGGIRFSRLEENQRRDQAEQIWDRFPEETREAYIRAGIDKERFPNFLENIVFWFTVVCGIATVAGVVTLLGARRMIQMRSYGLAMTGSILAAVPFVSCLGCCGMGQAIGIWALVVLLNSDVRLAFQASTHPPDDDEERWRYGTERGPRPGQFPPPD